MKKKQEKATRLRDLKVSARDQLMIDPRIIKIEDGHNPRNYTDPENREHLEELKRSIAKIGVKVPLLVRFDQALGSCVLVDGECRLRACLDLIAAGVDIKAVPTIQVHGNNEADRLATALVANTGKPLTKLESGAAYMRLIGYGWSPAQIAEHVGQTVRYVNEAVELADAPEAVKKMVADKSVSPALALSAMRENGAEAVEKLREAALSARQSGQLTAKRERTGPNNIVNSNAIAKAARAIFEDVDLGAIDPDFKFFDLSVNTERLIALARALGLDTKAYDEKLADKIGATIPAA